VNRRWRSLARGRSRAGAVARGIRVALGLGMPSNLRFLRSRGSFVLLASSLALAACSSASTSAPEDPGQARTDAMAIANGYNPCTTDADCCVVVDNCMSEVFVVDVAHDDEVTALAAQAQKTPPSVCLGCAIAQYQLACNEGHCVAHPVMYTNSKGETQPGIRSTHDHCGALPLGPGESVSTSAATAPSQSGLKLESGVLGCGANYNGL
jgi:hypothetical protein